ncbi:hypothetical protein FPOAC2_13553 [Fusarium poae]
MLHNIPSEYKSGAIRLLQFLVYAKRPLSLSEVSAKTSEDIVRTTVSFLRDETTFQLWCHLYQADLPWKDEPGPPRAPRLYYACLAGLAGAARDLTTEGANVNAQGGEYGNALQADSHGGNPEITELLNLNNAKMIPRKRSSSTNIRERTEFPRL